MATWYRVLLLLVALLSAVSATAKTESPPAEKISRIKAKTNHILVDTEAQAKEIKAKLEASERLLVDFAHIAIKDSQCKSGEKGGDLGWIGRGLYGPAFDAVVFDKEPRKVYIAKTDRGWHVVYTIHVGDPEVLLAYRETWSYTLKSWFNSAAPFLSPLLLIVIFFVGSRSAISGSSGPRARASHILVKTEAEADALLKAINKADDKAKKLAALAKTNSTCPSGKKGGDLGMFGKGQMVPAFEKIAFEKEVGSIHKVETQFGWHIVMVNERIGDKKKD